MKAYVSYALVMVAALGLFFIYLLSYQVFPSHMLVESISLRNEELSLWGSIELTAKYGCVNGIVDRIYRESIERGEKNITEVMKSLTIAELEKSCEQGALSYLSLLEENKWGDYALFCTNNCFDERALERAMLEEKRLVIPTNAKHLSEQCRDLVKSNLFLSVKKGEIRNYVLIPSFRSFIQTGHGVSSVIVISNQS